MDTPALDNLLAEVAVLKEDRTLLALRNDFAFYTTATAHQLAKALLAGPDVPVVVNGWGSDEGRALENTMKCDCAAASVWARRVACSYLSSAGAVALLSLLFISGWLLIREVKAQTQGAQFYVQVALPGEKMAALTNAAAIINSERTGDNNTPFVTTDAVFMTITSQEVNDLCNRLISTDPKVIVRKFKRKD